MTAYIPNAELLRAIAETRGQAGQDGIARRLEHAAETMEELYEALRIVRAWTLTHNLFPDNAEWPACANRMDAALSRAQERGISWGSVRDSDGTATGSWDEFFAKPGSDIALVAAGFAGDSVKHEAPPVGRQSGPAQQGNAPTQSSSSESPINDRR